MNIVKFCLIGENVLGKKNVNRISELCYVIVWGMLTPEHVKTRAYRGVGCACLKRFGYI